jgi:hypothetical protein
MVTTFSGDGLMPYTFSVAKLKQLYNYDLKIKNQDGSPATMTIPEQPKGWPRSGAEAYGLKTVLSIERPTGQEKLSAFMKVFRTDVTARHPRTSFLIRSTLAKRSDWYGGIPFLSLGQIKIGNVEVIAHATRMIPGPFDGGPEDLKRLRDSERWHTYTQRERAHFCAELACATAGLERAGIVHGDISPGNTLIGFSAKREPICILCDYDGFNHAEVPRLPRKIDGMPCRPLGSEGYQYPDLLKALAQDKNNDADIWVETDRFALAVGICEMMAWSEAVEKYLEEAGRGALLSDDMVLTRDLSLPKTIRDTFPKGFDLLERALLATSPAAMPSSEDWLRVLGFEEEPAAYKGRPHVSLAKVNGTYRTAMRRFG